MIIRHFIFLLVISILGNNCYAELSSGEPMGLEVQLNNPKSDHRVRRIECRSRDGNSVVNATVGGDQLYGEPITKDFNRNGTLEDYESFNTVPDFNMILRGNDDFNQYPEVTENLHNLLYFFEGPFRYELRFYPGHFARRPENSEVILGHPGLSVHTDEYLEDRSRALEEIRVHLKGLRNRDFILTIHRIDTDMRILTPEDNNVAYSSNFTYLRCVEVHDI